MELGCGAGLVGIAAVKTCNPSKYVLTDCHETVLETVMENVKINCKGEGKLYIAIFFIVISLNSMLIINRSFVMALDEVHNGLVGVSRFDWTESHQSQHSYEADVILAAGQSLIYI